MTHERRYPLGLVTCQAEQSLSADDQTLLPHLIQAGIDPQSVVWDDPGQDLSSLDGLLMRSVWDYHLKYPAFLTWLESVENSGIPVWNEPDTIRWNSNKLYLLELKEAGLEIPRTTPLMHQQDEIPDEIFNTPIVLKPAISADSFRTIHVSSLQRSDIESALSHILSHSPALLQEFMPEIISEGEYSFIFLEGIFMHAVLKRPATDDFRVQEELGGTVHPITPSQGLIAEAERVIRLLDPMPAFARVDGVRRGSALVIMELELIEPSLYLLQSEDTARQLARLCRERLVRHA